MGEIKRYVKVDVNKLTKGISQQGFGLVNIHGENLTVRQKEYAIDDAAGLAADLASGVSDPEYQAFVDIAGLPNPPQTVLVSAKLAGDADFTTSLNAVVSENPDFYGVILADRTLANQKEVADWVQANERVAIFASDSGEIIGTTPSADNIAKYVQDNVQDRCMVMYSSAASTRYVDAATLASYLNEEAGSYNPGHFPLTGVPFDTLTEGEVTAATALLASTFENFAGLSEVNRGWVGDGTYFDITHFIDWLKARLSESVFRTLHVLKKVPHNDSGYAIIQTAMDEVFQTAIVNGAVGQNEYNPETEAQIRGYIIEMPRKFQVPTNDIANRELNNVKATVWYETPINIVRIVVDLTL